MLQEKLFDEPAAEGQEEKAEEEGDGEGKAAGGVGLFGEKKGRGGPGEDGNEKEAHFAGGIHDTETPAGSDFETECEENPEAGNEPAPFGEHVSAAEEFDAEKAGEVKGKGNGQQIRGGEGNGIDHPAGEKNHTGVHGLDRSALRGVGNVHRIFLNRI